MLDLRRYTGLTAGLRETWERDGYVHLKGALSRRRVAGVRAFIDNQWVNRARNPHHVDILTGPMAGACYPLSDVPDSARQEAYKLNNLFLNNAEIREAALSPYLKKVLGQLLGGEPMICNSLNFERGSQQEPHIDSWFMPSPTEDGMVAASVSLDPVDEDNGPVFFFPGSHKIPPYRFSDGRLNLIQSEAADCNRYLAQEIAKRGLKKLTYTGAAGDIFIWHGQLLHGGSPIHDFSRTRNSLVVHYWRASAVSPDAVRRDHSGAYLSHTLRGELSPA